MKLIERHLCVVVQFALAAVMLVGCTNSTSPSASPEATGTPWFEEATREVRLAFIHDPGTIGSYFMPQSMGSGGAFLDFDQDGRLDIYLVQGAGFGGAKNKLFRQQDDGTFRDASAGSGLDVAGFGTGVAIGDVNNDGLPDLFLTEYGRLRLFINEGDGKFKDISREAGFESLRWGTSSSFLDFDRDGWLDLVVVNYVDYDPTRPCYGRSGERDFCSPTQFDGTPALLYRNITGESKENPSPSGRGQDEGNSAKPSDQSDIKPAAEPTARAERLPRFENVTDQSGLGALPGPGLGVVCADFNGDGWEDIFVANDQEPNRLWINRQDGTFADEALARGIALNGLGRAGASMGTAWGDINTDGLPDLFVTKLDVETHTVWRQGPAGLFKDGTVDAGLARIRRSTGFGTALADFDLDGDLDLAYVNGRVFSGPTAANKDLPAFWRPYAESSALLENDGNGRFTSIAADNRDFCGTPEVARSLCTGDIDNDGDLDMLVSTTAGPARLFRNVAPRKGHWLSVRVMDPALNRDAYGAVVTIKAGDRAWQRLVNPGTSYQCSHDPRVHFGLGNATKIDEIRIRWPDGAIEIFPGGDANRLLTLRKGEGAPP